MTNFEFRENDNKEFEIKLEEERNTKTVRLSYQLKSSDEKLVKDALMAGIELNKILQKIRNNDIGPDESNRIHLAFNDAIKALEMNLFVHEYYQIMHSIDHIMIINLQEIKLIFNIPGNKFYLSVIAKLVNKLPGYNKLLEDKNSEEEDK